MRKEESIVGERGGGRGSPSLMISAQHSAGN